MRDEDGYIIIERERGGGFGSFLMGTLVGAGLALLFAPQSGEETQEEIKTRARQLRDTAEEKMREAQHTLEERLDEARHGVESRVDSVREAVESGRQAAREARQELGERVERSKAAYRAGIDAARSEATADGEDRTGEGEE